MENESRKENRTAAETQNGMGTERKAAVPAAEKTPAQPETDQSRRADPDKERAERSRRFMRKNYAFFGGISALYALFYTFCLYRNASGITWPFFAAGTLVYFGLCMKRFRVPWNESISSNENASSDKNASSDENALRNGIVPSAGRKDCVFCAAAILLLGVSVFLTDNPFINSVTKAAVLLLTVSMMLRRYLDDRRQSLSGYLTLLGQALLETVASLAFPVSDGNAWLKEREKEGKNAKGRYVILGLLILCPLLAVILALLASADLVFRELFLHLFDYVKPLDILAVCFMLGTMFFASYSFVSMLNEGVLKAERAEKKKQEPVLAITVTSVLAVVYLIFCGIQIAFLFLRQAGLPEGQSYASYARQGFFQLLAVCVINLVIVLICLSCFRESGVLKGILAVISLCTCCMAVSSAYRMLLYIGVYRLTFLRLLVLWALAVIGVLLAGILCSIFMPRFPLLRYMIAAVTVCYIFLAFAKPDYWIARYNMAHVSRDAAGSVEELTEDYGDYLYLTELSADAVPVLASEENYGFLCGRTDRMPRYFDRMEERTEEIGVRTFNLSRYLAKKALEKVR